MMGEEEEPLLFQAFIPSTRRKRRMLGNKTSEARDEGLKRHDGWKEEDPDLRETPPCFSCIPAAAGGFGTVLWPSASRGSWTGTAWETTASSPCPRVLLRDALQHTHQSRCSLQIRAFCSSKNSTRRKTQTPDDFTRFLLKTRRFLIYPLNPQKSLWM